jgi:L,D-transpeptidase catalytic domain
LVAATYADLRSADCPPARGLPAQSMRRESLSGYAFHNHGSVKGPLNATLSLIASFVLCGTLLCLSGCGTSPESRSSGGAAHGPPPWQHLVASAGDRTISLYAAPSVASRRGQLASRNSNGVKRVFLVVGQRPGWLHVLLPVRPNGAKRWIRVSDVSLAHVDYALKVELNSHRLLVSKGPRVISRERIGVGRSVTPTPNGLYFITELLEPPNPNGVYGRYAFGTSAYSNVLTSFGGGNGQIGIHGTNDPAGLGTNVSHGCIRLSNEAITRLAKTLPLGTPVTITRA